MRSTAFSDAISFERDARLYAPIQIPDCAGDMLWLSQAWNLL
jgi:hypothetical protein